MADEDENESTVFEITDFTAASEWERFVSQIEEILHKWKVDNSNKKPSFLQRVRNFSSSSNKEGKSGNLKPIPKKITSESKQSNWETLSESVHFSDFCFDITYHSTASKNERHEENSGFEDGLPYAVLDMFNMDYDFPPRVHCLSRWYGLKEFIVLSPSVENAAITSESRYHLLLSSVSMALSNSKCYIPLLVQLHHKWRRLYSGLCLGGGFRTCFEMSHLRHIPTQFNHLKGLLDVFKDKLSLRGTSSPAVTITVRFTYFLNDWSDTVWPQAPPDVDSCLGDEVGLSDMATLPFGAVQDAVSELHLSVTWPCLYEDIIVDNGIYSDLDPLQAPQWHVRVRMNDDANCLLGGYLDRYLSLCYRKEATSSLKDDLYDDSDDKNKDFANAFQKLTKPVLSSNIRSAVTKATSKITGSSSDESPIPAELLNSILKHLFPDAELHPNDIDIKQETLLKSNIYATKDIPSDKFRGLKSAPKESLTYSLAICLCIVNHSYGGLRAVARLWQEFVLEMRYRWDRGILISRLELEAPNLDCSLIHQKLQMLNCCIARKCLSKRSQTSINDEMSEKHFKPNDGNRPASARSKHSHPDDDSSEDEFFEALENQDDSDDSGEDEEGNLKTVQSNTRREGALKRCGDLRLLISGEPLYIPVTQEPAPMTEDMLQAHADVLTQLGTTEEGARIRAQMQSACLLSDMEAFKAANPGCLLEDFVRWYSPNDWIQGEETQDEIEYRRKMEGDQRQQEEEQQDGEDWGTNDDEITEEELSEALSEDDKQNEKLPRQTTSKNWCEEGRLSLRMRVQGNIWEDNWRNARPCPVRRQKRLFDETKEAEKVFHYLSGLRPAEVATELISSLLQASIRRIEKEGDSVHSSAVIDRVIKKASRIFDTSQEQLAVYENLFEKLRRIEIKIAQAQSLKFKLQRSEVDHKSDIDTEAFIASLLEKPEVNVVGASRGPMGHVIKNLFSKQEILREQEQDYDNHEISKAPTSNQSKPFPAPAGREFVLRTITNYPGRNSRECPQRMYCVLAGEEFRLAAAFTSDTTFT
ncbi:rab3 GTPase-activating protein catalytic subunit-like isoform X2 [Dendronephthya gigantea]|uniref:rab3 GTPase-activating protein catalytic subunit-like isoform X2 n=1 Tax=Dendronephthya gigantea TaxID=151771 RepID=UPI00106A959E|nr:rab3 GTPase-activating protein catalytic subunit-like isoform X2 [Dendronephthya gigantea]